MNTQPPVSPEQQKLAGLLEITLAGDSFETAAAKLLDAVAESLGFEPAQPSSLRQQVFAESLGMNVVHDSKRHATAKIGERLLELNRQAITDLDLKPGDRVLRIHRFEHEGEERTFEQEFVISSIQLNGRVFFKGGNGQGAWPTQLRRVKSEI